MSRQFAKTAVAVAMALTTTGLTYADKAAPGKSAQADIEKTIRERLPDVKIVSVIPSTIAGLYEIYTGDNLIYSDASGDHLVMGPLVETRSKRNVTTERLDEILSIEFAKLPLDHAIKTVRGNGKKILAVFSDPDCPYCKALEKQLAAITDITIYTFLFPLADLHPEAPKRALAIWCADDRSVAWEQWMMERRLPEDRQCDGSAIEQNLKLGEELRVASTPTMYTGSGRRVSGLRSSQEIQAAFDADR